jgi:spore germination protein YaaH
MIAVVALVATTASWFFMRHRTRPTSPRSAPPSRVFAFVSDLKGAELQRLKRVGSRIDVVAPNWYGMNVATGALRGSPHTAALRALARRHHVAVWPVVNARTAGSAAWTAPAARERIVQSLLSAASADAGVTLDMEELRPDQRGAFSALIAGAAARLHAAGRRLAVYVPRTGGAYDWKAIAAHADLLLASGYNEHWSGSAPGPTTTSTGFADVRDRALAAAGPRKAVPLLGAFGYRWAPGQRGKLIGSADAAALRRRIGARGQPSDGSERFRSGPGTVVYETTAGLRARAAAARKGGARWIGLFSLGREERGFWTGFPTFRAP